MVPLRDAKGQVVLDEQGQPRMTPAVRPRKSDNLLMFLIKAKRPEYRDSAWFVPSSNGPGGDPGLGEKLLEDFDACNVPDD
jgi:hypothetical protein